MDTIEPKTFEAYGLLDDKGKLDPDFLYNMNQWKAQDLATMHGKQVWRVKIVLIEPIT